MKIMYTQADGSVAIIHGAPKENIERDLGVKLTEKEYKDRVRLTVPNDAINPREIDPKDIPDDREFRGAWVDKTIEPVVDIDLIKAKEIKLELIRQQRVKLFDKADGEFMRALETGAEAELIAAKEKKAMLRNLTEGLKALDVKDIAELKGVDIETYLK